VRRFRYDKARQLWYFPYHGQDRSFSALQARASVGVNLMATNRVFRSVLLASGVLLTAACASQTASTTGSLDEKYFQREAKNYQKFQHEGQTVYCQSERQATSLIPYKWCISESALRQRVENDRRSRNAVTRGGPPYVATVPGG